MFGFSDFRSRCLITVMDKWAKCEFLRVVGGEHICVYIYTCMYMCTYVYVSMQIDRSIDRYTDRKIDGCMVTPFRLSPLYVYTRSY